VENSASDATFDSSFYAPAFCDSQQSNVPLPVCPIEYDAAMHLGVGKYRLGPFLMASEIPIPELEMQPTGQPDVLIRVGKVPERLDNVVANESRWWASRDEYLLRVPGVAGFLVSRGREVTVEPAADALPADIRAYLLSPIFSTLCYQAGMYSLHASSVRAGDGVVAFLGHSGAGKSTLAAYLERRGYAVVSDDICLLDPRAAETGGAQGGTVVVPVAPALKLWRSAVEQLGVSPDDLPRVFSRDDKYRMKTRPPGETEERLPLREVFFLEWADEPGTAADFTAEFTPVEGVHAIARLMEFTNYDYLMKPTGRQTGNFLLCGRILSQVRAFAFRRPRDFARIDRAIDALEEHLAGMGEK
jgi:hypothetical protein